MTGVPSSTSMASSVERAGWRRRAPSSRATCRPIGFGRAGERSAKTPLASAAWRGFWTIRFRGAWCSQVRMTTWLARSRPAQAAAIGRVDLERRAGCPVSRAARMFFGQSSRVVQGERMRPMKTTWPSAGIAAGSIVQRVARRRASRTSVLRRRLPAPFSCPAATLAVANGAQYHINICLYLFEESRQHACHARHDG